VTVDVLHVPAGRLEALHLICTVRQRDRAVDCDVVVVPEDNQLAQLVAARKANGLLADALHQATIACDHIGVVIHDLLAVLRALDFLGHGKTDRIGDALTQRACGGLDCIGQKILGVTGCARAQLAEVLDLIQRDLRVPNKIEQGIQQHRAVASRQDKAVAVGPERIGRIKLEVFFKQNRSHIGHPHGHTRVTRIGGVDRIQRQGADGGRFHPVIRVGGAKRRDVQGRGPLHKGSSV